MPRGDRTGPEGKGPKTGRGLGLCSGSDKPGYLNNEAPRQGLGRGLGRGIGRGPGLGRGRGIGRELTKEEEIKILEQEKTEIEKTLKELKE